MKGNYLVETGDWDSEIASYDCELDDLNVATRAAFHFIEGMKAHRAEDTKSLATVIAGMEKERKSAANLVSEKGIATCAPGPGSYAPNQLDVDQANVLEMELLGLLAQLQGSNPEVEKWLSAAAELQGKISYSYGPPPIVKPSWELYGDWLLEQGRAKDALTQFEKALEKGPRRVMALRGKLEAAKLLKDGKMVKETEEELAEILKKADKKVI